MPTPQGLPRPPKATVRGFPWKRISRGWERQGTPQACLSPQEGLASWVRPSRQWPVGEEGGAAQGTAQALRTAAASVDSWA